MSLLLTIFILTFVTQLISWVGQSVLQDSVSNFLCQGPDTLQFLLQVYDLYLLLTNSDLAKRQRDLKKNLLVKKTELLKLSPKDQFAKYFKLERSVKQELSELEKLSTYTALFILQHGS